MSETAVVANCQSFDFVTTSSPNTVSSVDQKMSTATTGDVVQSASNEIDAAATSSSAQLIGKLTIRYRQERPQTVAQGEKQYGSATPN